MIPGEALATYDVVVVGAGPAGGTAAYVLARSGVRVLLADRADFPRWKVCGGCVGGSAVALLGELGLAERLTLAGARPLGTMLLCAAAERVEIGLEGSVALSRGTLDALLADAAAAAGAEVRFGLRVEQLRPAGSAVELRVRDATGRRSLRAAAVVDATGLGGLGVGGDRVDEDVSDASRVGLGAVYPTTRRHPSAGEVDDGLRMVVGRVGYVGMVRLEDGRLNVAAVVDREALAHRGPEQAVRAILRGSGFSLPQAVPELGWRGTPPLTRTPVSVAERGVFRVGDAAGYVEPFTGEGIGWAIACGSAVASPLRKVIAGEVDTAEREWRRTHRRLVVRRQRLCELLASGLRRPRLVRGAVRTLALAPRLARPLVRLTTRDLGSALRAGAWRGVGCRTPDPSVSA